jgi:hypothetical protein
MYVVAEVGYQGFTRISRVAATLSHHHAKLEYSHEEQCTLEILRVVQLTACLLQPLTCTTGEATPLGDHGIF